MENYEESHELSSKAEQAQNRILNLIATLEDDDVNHAGEFQTLKDNIDNLMGNYFDGHLDLETAMHSIIDSFKQGLISQTQLESMLRADNERSGIILKVANALKQQLNSLFVSFGGILEKKQSNEQLDISDLDSFREGMTKVLQSVDSISRVVTVPVNKLTIEAKDIEEKVNAEADLQLTPSAVRSPIPSFPSSQSLLLPGSSSMNISRDSSNSSIAESPSIEKKLTKSTSDSSTSSKQSINNKLKTAIKQVSQSNITSPKAQPPSNNAHNPNTDKGPIQHTKPLPHHSVAPPIGTQLPLNNDDTSSSASHTSVPHTSSPIHRRDATPSIVLPPVKKQESGTQTDDIIIPPQTTPPPSSAHHKPDSSHGKAKSSEPTAKAHKTSANNSHNGDSSSYNSSDSKPQQKHKDKDKDNVDEHKANVNEIKDKMNKLNAKAAELEAKEKALKERERKLIIEETSGGGAGSPLLVLTDRIPHGSTAAEERAERMLHDRERELEAKLRDMEAKAKLLEGKDKAANSRDRERDKEREELIKGLEEKVKALEREKDAAMAIAVAAERDKDKKKVSRKVSSPDIKKLKMRKPSIGNSTVQSANDEREFDEDESIVNLGIDLARSSYLNDSNDSECDTISLGKSLQLDDLTLATNSIDHKSLCTVIALPAEPPLSLEGSSFLSLQKKKKPNKQTQQQHTMNNNSTMSAELNNLSFEFLPNNVSGTLESVDSPMKIGHHDASFMSPPPVISINTMRHNFNFDIVLIEPSKKVDAETSTDDFLDYITVGECNTRKNSMSDEITNNPYTNNANAYDLDRLKRELPIVSSVEGLLVTRTYRQTLPKVLANELAGSETPLLALYEEFSDLLNDVYKTRLLHAAIDEKHLKAIHIVAKVFKEFESNIARVDGQLDDILHAIQRSENIAADLIVLSDTDSKTSKQFAIALSEMSRMLGEAETHKLWVDIQLIEYRSIMEKANALGFSTIPSLLQGSKEFAFVYSTFFSAQGKSVEIANRLAILKERSYRHHLMNPPPLATNNKHDNNGENIINTGSNTKNIENNIYGFQDLFSQSTVSQTSQSLSKAMAITDEEDEYSPDVLLNYKTLQDEIDRIKRMNDNLRNENEDLNIELLEAYRAADKTPGVLQFFSAMHEPSTIPVFQQLVLQLNCLKSFSDGSEHLDFGMLRRRVQVCVSSAPTVDRFLHKYNTLYKKWIGLRIQAFKERNLTGGTVDASNICPLCCNDIRHDQPQAQTPAQTQSQGPSYSTQGAIGDPTTGKTPRRVKVLKKVTDSFLPAISKDSMRSSRSSSNMNINMSISASNPQTPQTNTNTGRHVNVHSHVIPIVAPSR